MSRFLLIFNHRVCYIISEHKSITDVCVRQTCNKKRTDTDPVSAHFKAYVLLGISEYWIARA